MTRRIGDLRPGDLVEKLRRLEERVAALERRVNAQAVVMVSDGVTLGPGHTSYTRLAWSSFPRSGSLIRVEVNVTLTGASSVDLALWTEGVEIATVNITGSGTAALNGFLPDSWQFGDRRRLELYGRLNNPGTGASGQVTVLGAELR